MYYLYVKKHNVTKLKYLGQTQNNPEKYKGSGKYWTRHIKKHGYDVTTIVLLETKDMDELCRVSKFFSDFFDVMDSKEWANLIPETGFTIDGVNETGRNRGEWHQENLDAHMKKMSTRGNQKKKELFETDQEWKERYLTSLSRGCKKRSAIHGSPFKGKTHSEEWKERHSLVMKEKQSGNKNSQFGTMWITDGVNNKKIKKDIDVIPEGWRKGRVV